MSTYQLYGFAQSGHSYKVALMLELLGVDWQVEKVDFFKGETRSDEYRNNVNEMGEVPVLVENGEKMTQSGVILDYLADKYDQFGGKTAAEKRDIWRWVLYDNHKISSQIGPLRFMVGIKKMDENDVTKYLRGRITDALGVMEKHLDGQDYFVGNRATIADFTLCSYLFFADEFGYDWADYPHIDRWLNNIKGLKGWQHPYDLLPKLEA
ncbi:MAG: glutathione S-transferase family protein [Alphaproteobacteria bacterium]|nr:glutathione S-transferase family protein [Alphaproteobacteria bacterium]